MQNFFADIPASTDQEHIQPLLESPALKIERIISNGHPSPPDFWYDQDENEWVMLLTGTATLKFEDGTTAAMAAGDYLLVKRHAKHRVASVSADAVWLAVHYKIDPSGDASGRTCVSPGLTSLS